MDDSTQNPEEPVEDKPKKKASSKKAKAIPVFDGARLERTKVGNLVFPTAVFKTKMAPETGDLIEIKTDGGNAFAGEVDEVTEVDGETCVTFKGALQPA